MPTAPPTVRAAVRADGAKCLAWAFVAVGAVVVSWTLATPLMAAPDEPAQINNAAAVVRGQLDEPTHPYFDIGRESTVRVPAWVGNAAALACFAFKPSVPASCSPRVAPDPRLVNASTQFSNYPPLYFAVVGLPTLWWSGSSGLYAARLAGDLLTGGLLALGLYLLARYHPRRLPLLGALVALSPMVFFLSSIVNDSGLEVAAAFAAWCGGLCLIEREVPERSLVLLTGLAFLLLILARPISPANAAVILVVLGLAAGWKRTHRLLTTRALRPGIVLVVVAGAVALTSLAIGGDPSLLGARPPKQLTFLASAASSLRLTNVRLLQSIGDFGWLDTPVPRFTTVVWTTAVGALAATALVRSRSCRRALPVLVLAVIAAPVVFEAPLVNQVGNYWQGRYELPLLMGVPLVASTMARRVARHRRPAPPVGRILVVASGGAMLAVAQLAAFLTGLHRYETGLGVRPGTPATWSPPGGHGAVIVLFLVGQGLLVAFAAFYAGHAGSVARSPTDRQVTSDVRPNRRSRLLPSHVDRPSGAAGNPPTDAAADAPTAGGGAG
jgi:hypothetical protein